MFSVTKSIDIDFAHHISGHNGHCINIHGHTWKFEVTLASDTLDGTGFVVDFAKLKREVLRPVHDLLDHTLAIGKPVFEAMHLDLLRVASAMVDTRCDLQKPVIDPDAEITKQSFSPFDGATRYDVGGLAVVVFDQPPTSERLANLLYRRAADTMVYAGSNDDRGRGLRVVRASVYETLHPVQAIATYARMTG